MSRSLFVALSLAAAPGSSTAQPPCDLQGAWELVSAKYDNEPASKTYAALKVFTKTRFTVVGMDTALRGPLSSDADRLKFFANLVAVGGTYTVSGNTWTETLDYFADPAYLGVSATFQCQQDGDHLVQKGTLPVFTDGKRSGEIPLEETWRRVDRP